MTALGLLVGSGASWRSVAKGIEKEASQMGLNGVKKSVTDSFSKLDNNKYYAEVKGKFKRTGSHFEPKVTFSQKEVPFES